MKEEDYDRERAVLEYLDVYRIDILITLLNDVE